MDFKKYCKKYPDFTLEEAEKMDEEYNKILPLIEKQNNNGSFLKLVILPLLIINTIVYLYFSFNSWNIIFEEEVLFSCFAFSISLYLLSIILFFIVKSFPFKIKVYWPLDEIPWQPFSVRFTIVKGLIENYLSNANSIEMTQISLNKISEDINLLRFVSTYDLQTNNPIFTIHSSDYEIKIYQIYAWVKYHVEDCIVWTINFINTNHNIINYWPENFSSKFLWERKYQIVGNTFYSKYNKEFSRSFFDSPFPDPYENLIILYLEIKNLIQLSYDLKPFFTWEKSLLEKVGK